MSAPTKCDQCGAKGTYAIQVPCVMKCGGMMYFDHDAAVPEQGLREALERIANYEYYINDAAGVPVMMKKIARAALERPRPAPEPHLEREGNHIRAVGFGSGPLAPDFIPSHESKAGAALPAPTYCEQCGGLCDYPLSKACRATKGGASLPAPGTGKCICGPYRDVEMEGHKAACYVWGIGAALPAAHVCYVRDGDTLFLGKGLIAKIVGENK